MSKKKSVAAICALLIVGVAAVLIYGWPRSTDQQHEVTPPPVTQKQEEPNFAELPAHLDHLKTVTVRVQSQWAQGSGILVRRNGVSYVWTAQHIVGDLQGLPATIVTPKGSAILADVEMQDALADIALLRLREEPASLASTIFVEDGYVPREGATVYHVGTSPLHPSPYATKGTVRSTGKVYEGQTYDVTSLIGIAGSGGGGIFEENGRCIGLLARGGTDFCLIIPHREIRQWAQGKGVLWVLDPTVPKS